MRTVLSVMLAVCSLLFVAGSVQAQDSVAVGGKPAKTVEVYLDCSYFCDADYIHTRIAYVDWVRDRTASDVDVLVSTQGTAANGTRYTFTFLGRRSYATLADTLRFSTIAGASSDDIRRDMVRVLKEGLVRYVAHTAVGPHLVISVPKRASSAEQTTPKHDPWHAWVFTTSVNGDVFAEQLTKQEYLFGTLTASRTTNAWKVNLSSNESYQESRYTIQDPDTTIVNIQRSLSLSGLLVKSLGPHWSAGLKGSLSSSTFLNEKRNLVLTPAIEYDVMPYSESTRRQLRIQYGLGFDMLAYNDTTIFLKTGETLPVHTLSVAYAQQEPWGSVSVGADGSSFLNDGAKHSANISGSTSLKLVRGLNLSLSGSYSILHDQVYIAKGTATQAEVLLQQRQLLTSYRWSLFFGLSYTFGSLFNNVVNPRFGSTGSGTTIIIM